MEGAIKGELMVIAYDLKDIHVYYDENFEFLTDIVDDLIINVCNSANNLGRHTTHYLHTVVHVRITLIHSQV